MNNAALPLGPGTSTVVICPRVEGHRLSYARLLVARAAERGESVDLVVPSGARGAPEYALHMAEHSANIRLCEVNDFDVRTLQRIFDERPGAVFIFPDGDDVVPLLAMRKLRPNGALISVLMMRPNGQAATLPKRLLATAAKSAMRQLARSRRGVKVFSLVPSTAGAVGRNEIRDPIEFAPEPSLSAWRLKSGPPTWFGIVGAITRRKNIDLVAQALAELSSKVGLVIAGSSEIDEEELERWTAPMRAAGHSVVRVNRQLSDSELDTIIASIDVAVIAHSNDGPSGIMGKADVAGRHVLAAGAQTLRRELRGNSDLGVWTPLTVPAMARGAGQVMSMGARQPRDARGGREAFSRRLRRESERK